jgi:CO/xanthine dehydrogenase FAD-binding subunit
MRDFDLLIPNNLSSALDALAPADPGIRPLAGGTDMIVDVRARRAEPDVLVALDRVAELRGIGRENGTVRIGAATPIAEFLKHPALLGHDALRQAAFVFANPMIRNLATVAGNIASASPAGDMLTPLLALDAQVELVSSHSSRAMPLDQFFLGPRKTARRSDELIHNMLISGLPTGEERGLRSASAFYKLGLRRADAIALVSVAVWLERDGERVREVRIAMGAVAPRPMRASRAEAFLRGQVWSDALIAECARLASAECTPIDDLRASANYRRRMIAVYVRRMLEQAWQKTR